MWEAGGIVFEGLPIGVLSSSAIAALAVLSVIRGWLVPSRQVDERLADVKQERDQWREAHRISEQARSLQAGQFDLVLENTRTTAQFIQALPRPERST